MRRGRECVPPGVEDDILLAVLLEDRRGVVGAGARLEAPQLLAVASVVGEQVTVRAADEDEVAACGRRARVAGLRPALLPDDAARPCVDRAEVPGVRAEAAGDGEGAAEHGLRRRARLGRGGFRRSTRRRHGSALRADVEHLRLRVVARGLPVRAALRSGREDDRGLPEGRVDGLRADRLHRVARGLRQLLHHLGVLLVARCVRDERARSSGSAASATSSGSRSAVPAFPGSAAAAFRSFGRAGRASRSSTPRRSRDAVFRRSSRRREWSGSARRSPRGRGGPSGSTSAASRSSGRARPSTRRRDSCRRACCRRCQGPRSRWRSRAGRASGPRTASARQVRRRASRHRRSRASVSWPVSPGPGIV